MEDEAWLKVGVAAVLARQYESQQRDFLEALATKLERALPAHVRVVRQRGLFSREKRVLELRLQLGVWRYILHSSKQGAPVAQRAMVVRGIVVGTEELSMKDWIDDVGTALEEHAQHHQQAADAVRRLVG